MAGFFLDNQSTFISLAFVCSGAPSLHSLHPRSGVIFDPQRARVMSGGRCQADDDGRGDCVKMERRNRTAEHAVQCRRWPMALVQRGWMDFDGLRLYPWDRFADISVALSLDGISIQYANNFARSTFLYFLTKSDNPTAYCSTATDVT